MYIVACCLLVWSIAWLFAWLLRIGSLLLGDLADEMPRREIMSQVRPDMLRKDQKSKDE
jgi:hypothetical protein